MEKVVNSFTLLILIVVAIATILKQDVEAQGGGNIVYGDLRIDSSKAREKVPNNFYVLLSSGISKGSERRQPVAPGGRFRFIDVPNGDYDLVVELESREVAKMRIIVQSPTPTDFRYDLDLAWTDPFSPSEKPDTVSVSYTRTAVQQKLFDEASSEKTGEKAVTIANPIARNVQLRVVGADIRLALHTIFLRESSCAVS